MLETAENILYNFLYVKNGENLLFVSDGANKNIIDSFKEVLNKKDMAFKEVKITSNRGNSSPIPEIEKELLWANVVIAPTSKSITWSSETQEAAKNGARIVTMPAITNEIFLKINKADFKEIYDLCELILKQVKGKDKIKITSKNGTDISFSIKNRIWEGDEAEEGKGFVKNLPTGEVYCAPLEISANGIIFIENWKNIIKKEDNAWIKIKDGKVIEWNAGAEPFIKAQSVENGLIIGEFGIGVNKEHKFLRGNILHDEKIYGSVHIAFGNNVSFGGNNKSNVHEDLIIMNPNVLIDGKELKW